MDRVAVVTTSINARPTSYEEWSKAGTLIVAGDQNSPARELEGYIQDLGGVYIRPGAQERYDWSDDVGWNCIQRRNAAIMWALQQKNAFDYVLTVDDDNHPQPNAIQFIKGHIKAMESTPQSVIGSRTGYLNTGMFCEPWFHQRGTPYGIDTNAMVRKVELKPRVVVSQAQVLGDPDCDAVDRMCNAPDVKAVRTNAVIQPGVYAAFNSQATLWRIEWAPVMAVLPGIGRYDDIFASFIFHRLARTFDVALFVGEPCVRQERNEHNLVHDLRAELWGMDRVFSFCMSLDAAHISNSMPLWMAYSELIYAAGSVLPRRTISFANKWVQDWRRL